MQELRASLDIPVVSIVSLADLIESLEAAGEYEQWLDPVMDYRRRYGVIT